MNRNARAVALLLCLAVFIPAGLAMAEDVSIKQVQLSNAAAEWKSAYDGEIVNVLGGVVTYADCPPGKLNPRIVVQDPNETQWAGVEMKIFDGTVSLNIGDQVTLTNVYVDEGSKCRGTTYLIFDAGEYGSAFTVNSAGHAITPTAVAPSILGAGDMSADPAAAEMYEGMLLMVQDVTVGNMDLGSHVDNYELSGPGGTCWATDYFNVDRAASEDYHAWTETARRYDAVIGILEQYQKTSSGYDYYQLMSRDSADLVPEPASIAILLLAAGGLAPRRRNATRKVR